MRMLAVIFLIAALIALFFLIYTLLHLKKLRITLAHPRVLVEAGLLLLFIIAAFVLR